MWTNDDILYRFRIGEIGLDFDGHTHIFDYGCVFSKAHEFNHYFHSVWNYEDIENVVCGNMPYFIFKRSRSVRYVE